jgi:uncharacterized iron-regulated protein
VSELWISLVLRAESLRVSVRRVVPAVRVSAPSRAIAIAFAVLACSPRVAEPPGALAPESSALPAWQSTLDRTHPLVGRVWDVAAERFVDERAMFDVLAGARVVAIGEQHDNPDHHVLEARIVRAIAARGRRPATVFEMLDLGKQVAVDRALVEHPGDPDAIARATDWAHSGWPDWALYRPVFAAAVALRLPVVAAGIDRDAARRIAFEGTPALDPHFVKTFALDTPLAPDVRAALEGEMRDAHCGLLPESMLDPMVLVQRVRDARLAERAFVEGERSGAVAIMGNGHARRDRGMPEAIARAYGGRVASIGLFEVRPALGGPEGYSADLGVKRLPFDFVWFTPRVSDEDHCAELRRAHPSK